MPVNWRLQDRGGRSTVSGSALHHSKAHRAGEATPFDWQGIEEKWIRAWQDAKIFESNPDSTRPKYFVTVAYPYPNSPQHIGHGRTYTTTDIYARFKRMRGFNVLFPMAFHYTGTPVLAMAKRIAANDKELIDEFVETYHVPKEKLAELTHPLNIARYFHTEIKQGMREIGFSIDWRREFTTIDPTYSRFIEWQFAKLREKGLITRGSHPVGWCPNDGNPVGQHDTKDDVEPEIGEFTLIKFEFEDAFLPTATLRPETVFGVTNIWVMPKANYVRAKVDGEAWIVSEAAVEKLSFLSRDVNVERQIAGTKLVGKYAVNPLTKARIPILPASFVDPQNATGVVMSVPGHAPYDYQALRDAQRQATQMKEFGVSPDVVLGLKPMSIIEFEGAPEIPAEGAVSGAGIKSQVDPKLEQVTAELYSREFHSGRMKPNTGDYSGLGVAEARDRVKRDLIKAGKADRMYEILNRPVFCRCGAQCVVKIFENQWFINYGDAGWKEKTRDSLKGMSIVPELFRPEFEYTIGWLREKACARKSGLGTKLPWDPDWIIESLSDSVIYMCYYTIHRQIVTYGLRPEQLSDQVFDYIFLGQGELNRLARTSGIDAGVLRGMREEFEYYYPLDARHSGRDLVPNHLTFFIFNHVAIFPRELWPRQIVSNGFVLMEGKKMSKSLANILPLRDAIKIYGADATRITMTSTAELTQDVDFSRQLAESIRERLERFYGFTKQVTEATGMQAERQFEYEDRWLWSRVQRAAKLVTEAIENYRVRDAVQHALYGLDNDIQWYVRRCIAKAGDPSSLGNTQLLRAVLSIRARLLAPFAPFIAEEVWRALGERGFVSVAAWPEAEMAQVDEKIEQTEEMIRQLVDDTVEIIRVTKVQPKAVYYYVASQWKWDAYLDMLRSLEGKELKIAPIIRRYLSRRDLAETAERAPKLLQIMGEELSKTSEELRELRLRVGRLNEFAGLSDARMFLKSILKAQVSIYDEDDPRRYDSKQRAPLSRPYRPAIYIE